MTPDNISPHERERRQRQSEDSLIQAAELRALLGGVSTMWVWRHQAELPKPIVIGKRRFWLRGEVAAYLEALAATRPSGEAA